MFSLPRILFFLFRVAFLRLGWDILSSFCLGKLQKEVITKENGVFTEKITFSQVSYGLAVGFCYLKTTDIALKIQVVKQNEFPVEILLQNWYGPNCLHQIRGKNWDFRQNYFVLKVLPQASKIIPALVILFAKFPLNILYFPFKHPFIYLLPDMICGMLKRSY